MNKNVLVMVLLGMSYGALSLHAYAGDNRAVEDSIKAECREESKNTDSPESYIEECVAEKLQAIDSEQGGGGDVPRDKI